LRTAFRWLVAGGFGAVVTASLFVAMSAAIDGVDIVGRMFRIFPLTQTAVPDPDDCADPEIASHLAVPIEGVIGHMRGDRLAPISDAVVVGVNAITGETPVDVSADGSFRFVAAFPDNTPTTCPGVKPLKEGTPQRLVVRAPGCVERIVPVTAAWVRHTVFLDCADRD
jgi:hypothetical protein